MTCHTLRDEAGNPLGIYCTRDKPRRCYTCSASRASLSCDGCDHVLCTACAVSPRQGLDFCPACFRPAFEHWKALGPFPASQPERRQAFRLWARSASVKFLELAKQRTKKSLQEVT